MYIPVGRHDVAANKSVLLWELWPTDERAGALPMMDSILWPLGETILLAELLYPGFLILSITISHAVFLSRNRMHTYTNEK